MVVGMTNPKSYILFGAILPQFVNRADGDVAGQMLLLALVSVLIGAVCDCAWGFAASAVRNWFARSPRRFEIVGGAGGLAMIGVGVTVAITCRKKRHDTAGVGQVRLAHPEVGDDVIPPPWGVPGDAGGAIHHVVEHDGHARRGQAGVGRVLAARSVVFGGLLHLEREPDRMVVQADHDAVGQQLARALLLLRGQAVSIRRHTAELRCQLETEEVLALTQIGVRGVAGPGGRLGVSHRARLRRLGGAGRPRAAAIAVPTLASPLSAGGCAGTRWAREGSRPRSRTRRTAS